MDKSPEEDLQQIKEKKYYVPHLGQGKPVALLGVNFSSVSRNIASWTGELLDERGELIQKLVPTGKQTKRGNTTD